MPSRSTPPSDPVWVEHDGQRVVAERGEPLAAALVAADRVLLSRSPKLHRPRGPFCMRGACDGCLARVDGEPNVMTCLHSAQGGERIETQNVLGTRGIDLMEATDYLFPRGIDHHKLLAGIRGVSAIVQSFARQVAGLGTLPSEAMDALSGRRETTDVLVVGSGEAGLSVAAALPDFNLNIVDDATRLGGNLSLLEPDRLDAMLGALSHAQATPRTTVVSLSREPGPGLFALLIDDRGARLVQPRAVVLATGCHDHMPEFGDNDLPGIFSGRAALRLHHCGVRLGRRVALVGAGPFSEQLVKLSGTDWLRVDPARVKRCSGRGRVRNLITLDQDKEKRIKIDAVVCEGPGAPAFELAVQAGASTRFNGAGFAPVCDDSGKVAEDVFCAGSVVGRAAPAERVAEAVRAALA